MSRVAAALLTLALAGIAVLAAMTRMLEPVVATVLVAQILIAAAPSPVGDGGIVPTPQFAATLAGAFVATAVAFFPPLLIGAEGTRAGIDGISITGVLAGLMPGVAVGLLVAIVAQLGRTDDRRALVPSLAVVVSLVLFAASASAWIGAARTAPGRTAVVLAGVALVGALCVWIGFGPGPAASLSSVLVGGAAAAALALRMEGPATWPFAAIVGVVVAGFAVATLVVGSVWTAGREDEAAAWGFAGALAFALTGPLVYVAAQMVSVPL